MRGMARPRGVDWKALRESVIEQRGRTCQNCEKLVDKSLPLILHHIDANPWNDELNNLKLLCSYCHDKVHNWR